MPRRTIDGGNTWTDFGTVVPPSITSNAKIRNCSHTGDVGNWVMFYPGSSLATVDVVAHYEPFPAPANSWTDRTVWTTARVMSDMAIDYSRGYAMVVSNTGYISLSTDHGTTWTERATPLFSIDVGVSIFYIPSYRRWVVSHGATATFQFSDDDGTTWTTVPATYAYEFDAGFAHGAFDGVAYIASRSGQVYHLSFDGGVSWAPFGPTPSVGEYGGSGVGPAMTHSFLDNRLLIQSGSYVYLSDNGAKFCGGV